eukprot:jgi/Ulvmu1/5801/UM025_0056.1
MASLQCRPANWSVAALDLRGGRHGYSQNYLLPKCSAIGVIDGKHVAVVGSCMSGLVVATHMVTLGARVDVYTNDNQDVDSSASESGGSTSAWPVLISGPAKDAIESAGMALGFDARHTFHGCQITGASDSEWLDSNSLDNSSREVAGIISITELAANIQGESRRVAGAQMSVHSHHGLTGGQPAAGELTFHNEQTGEEVAVKADLVVAADGASSSVRGMLQRHDPSLTFTPRQSGAATLRVLLPDAGGPDSWPQLETAGGGSAAAGVRSGAESAEGASLRYFRPAHDAAAAAGEHAALAVTALSHADGGSVIATLSASTLWWDEGRSKEEALEWLAAMWPQVPQSWLQEIAAACALVTASDSARLIPHKFLEPSKLGSGRALLVGAAAHSMLPHLSVACDSALTDGAAVASALRAADGDLDAVAAQFTAARLPQVLAAGRVLRDARAVATFPLHGHVVAPAGVPLPFLVSLLARLWNLLHRIMPGLVRHEWRHEWRLERRLERRRGNSAEAAGGRTLHGALATVAVVIFGGLLKAAYLT